MTDYLLKNVDKDLWRQFKTACAFYDINIRREFIRHIRNIVSDYNKAQQTKFKAQEIITKARQKA